MTNQILPPVYTSFETAYLVEDYPYGFRLRTQIKFWIETRKDKTQRVVSCTLNPKTDKWNKPKASTYSMVRVLFIDAKTGHLENNGLSQYDSSEAAKFLAEYGDGMTEWHKGQLTIFAAYHMAQDETGLKLYGATEEIRKIIYAKRDEILARMGREDLIAKIV